MYSGLPGFVDGSGNKNYSVIDPYGRFIYVIDAGSSSYPNGTIYGFTISQTNGSISAVTGSPFTANLNAGQYLIIDPTGQHLYAINNGNNTISAYQVNQSTGALTPLSTGATIPTGTGPVLATLDSTGTYLYVANNTAGSVSSYSIGAGGVLTSLGPDTVISGAVSVTDVAVTPNGKYLYVLDYGKPTVVPFVFGALYGYTLSSGVPSTTLIPGTPIPTGIAPQNIIIDPTSSLIAVDNAIVGGPGAISLFIIGSGGSLTSEPAVPTGTTPEFLTLFNAP